MAPTILIKLLLKELIKKYLCKLNLLIINNPGKDSDLYFHYYKLLDKIESFKKIITSIQNYSNNRESNGTRRINCSLFENFFEDDISELIKKKIIRTAQKNGNYKIFKIYFPYQIMIDLTKEIIVNHINKILNYVPDIKSIIYGGSVSSNDYIKSNLNHF